MKKYLPWVSFFLFLSAAIPLTVYLAKFWDHPLSGKTSDWGDFGSYLSGTGGFFLSALSFIGLVITLIITIENNLATQKLARKTLNETISNYQSQLELQSQINEEDKLLREREYNLSLFNSLIFSLNVKLDKKIYKTYNVLDDRYVHLNETDFILKANKEYDTFLEIDRYQNKDIEEDERVYELGNILDCDIILEKFRMRYPEEIIILMKLIEIITRTDSEQVKRDLIDQFHASTFRDRTFWLLIFAFAHMNDFRKFFWEYPSIVALPYHMLENPPPLHN